MQANASLRRTLYNLGKVNLQPDQQIYKILNCPKDGPQSWKARLRGTVAGDLDPSNDVATSPNPS
jgi:hypothetical protein